MHKIIANPTTTEKSLGVGPTRLKRGGHLNVAPSGGEAWAFLIHGSSHVHTALPALNLAESDSRQITGRAVLRVKNKVSLTTIPPVIPTASRVEVGNALGYAQEANVHLGIPLDELAIFVDGLNDFWPRTRKVRRAAKK